MTIVPYNSLQGADLIIDAVYEGDGGKLGGEPLSTLFQGIPNLGGFRASGRGEDKKFVILFTSGEDKDWPDRFDFELGRFYYFGDNKTPGKELHDTKPGGNRILRRVFDLLHSQDSQRSKIPPFFIFSKHPSLNSERSVQFRGVAVPGYNGSTSASDLIAVWKRSGDRRFQNYQAIFTILDVPVIDRKWLEDIFSGNSNTGRAPVAWRDWVRSGKYQALTAESTTIIRTPEQQIPDTEAKRKMLDVIVDHFQDNYFAFEVFAAHIFQMHDQRVVVDEITRGVKDGGRDAVGRYRLGVASDPVLAEFSLEAKCYRPPNDKTAGTTVGVKDVSRLISRIKHRQFGILVTTSIISRDVYKEVREDKHPIIFFSGKDITDILTDHGFSTPSSVHEMLEKQFPVARRDV